MTTATTASSVPPPAPAPAPAPPGKDSDDPRLGCLAGDRLCARCHFNLSGQPIVRERHCGLAIVRCPECGTPAALQEYPLLGRWATRLGYLAAAAWLGGMLLLAAVTSSVVGGVAGAVHAGVAAPYSAHVSKLYAEAQQANASTPGGGWAAVSAWWNGLDKDRMYADFGGAGALAWGWMWTLLAWSLVLVPLGAVWAVAVPHARARHWPLLGLVALLPYGVWRTIEGLSGQNPAGMMWGMAYYHEGTVRTELAVMPWAMAGALALMTAGFLTGRPLARGLVVVLLPPSRRGPLGFLWRTDGRRMPRGEAPGSLAGAGPGGVGRRGGVGTRG